ncbi:hypothetical protein [Micromonospora carbonacea]|uniref:Head decoration protein n=1 Tax=Micromonospora carbonacea TaxID=47853 RepID=A0A1C5A2N9_9ACTN|nr:hypothetical protein [Micromonospora carbonacea]SCF39406.1 hypothetical protein GA0070563_11117 [Micromonospora carbonacea]
MTDISVATVNYQVDKRAWLLSPHGTDPGTTPSITLDISAFTPAVHYPNGYIPSGTPLGRITATGLYGPYSVTDEVQTITQGGSGLTSYTLTYSGQTTASIAQAATAAQVQAALEALSNIGAGNVLVTGSPGGPYTVTFQGALADTNVAQMTSTPTGGTGTVTVATTTGGGTEGTGGLEVAAGLLFAATKVPNTADTSKDVGAAMLVHGFVKLSKLPFTLDANGQADLKLIHFVA